MSQIKSFKNEIKSDLKGNINFGSKVRQMLNLYNQSYGIGIQSSTLYYRSGSNFAWFKGGIHSDTALAPGSGGTLMMSMDTNGYLTAVRVYNAVFNDYAEFFPRGEDTEVGDIIALDIDSENEQYIKANNKSKRVIGIHSEEFGHIIGGEQPPDLDIDVLEFNLKKYIPIGLAGRCKVKVIGKVEKGDYIVPSKISGIGKSYDEKIDNKENIVGFLVESDNREDTRLLKVKIMG